MPLYDYDCAACGRRVEVVHGVHAPGPEHCPNCGGGPLKKAISAPTIHFKGSGWAKKERRAAAKSGTSDEGGSAAGDETKEPAKSSTAGNGGSDKGGDKTSDKGSDSGSKKSASATASTSD